MNYNEYGNDHQNQNTAQQPSVEAQYRPIEPPSEPKKRDTKKKIAQGVSLLLAVAVVGTASGFGGSLLYSNIASDGESITISSEPESANDLLNMSTTPNQNLEMSVSEIVSMAQPSVVEITTEMVAYSQFTQSYVSEGAGSGVIISADGYIVTNHHVIDGASKITVKTVDGATYDASLVGSDAETDLAVLKVDAKGLTAATIGSSADLTIGDYVLAIGNPLGQLGGTVSDGIISSLSREVTIEGETMTLLQTNAAINPGNSGGGLFNENGELIAIVNAKSSGVDIEGIGFAIPIDIAVDVVSDIIDVGYVQGRFSLGVSLLELNDESLAMMYRVEELGVYVQSLTQGGNAHIAGVAVGDRIVEFDGVTIEENQDVLDVLEASEANETLEMVVQRGDEQYVLSIVLYEDKAEEVTQVEQEAPRFEFGF